MNVVFSSFSDPGRVCAYGRMPLLAFSDWSGLERQTRAEWEDPPHSEQTCRYLQEVWP